MLQIRRAQQKDIEALVRLTEEGKNYHNSLRPGYLSPINKDFHRNMLSENMRDENALVLIAADNHQAVGMLLAYFKNHPWLSRPSVCMLETLCIDQKFRHRGIGQKLMGFLEKVCADRKIAEIVLEVYQNNTIAADFYKKQGYAVQSIKMTKKP